MPFLRLFGNSAANEAADRIIAAISQAARSPDLYGEGRVPDTLTGRFEMMTAFAALALMRLRSDTSADRVAQVFTDRLFRHFDAGLREAGVGDLSVSKRMKALASAFYGRLTAYDAAFVYGPAALAAALTRNVWDGAETPFAEALAARLLAVKAGLDAAPATALEQGTGWVAGG
jgi:cytochrome b pre-mRNA-processing protein 3